MIKDNVWFDYDYIKAQSGGYELTMCEETQLFSDLCGELKTEVIKEYKHHPFLYGVLLWCALSTIVISGYI